MITGEQAIADTTRATEAHATAGAEWGDAVRYTVRSLVDRLAAARGMPSSELAFPHVPDAERALDSLGPLEGWHVIDLGEIHQRLLELTPDRGRDGRVTANRKGLGRRDALGSWYTPPEVAEAMCRLSIGPQLDQLAAHPDPGNLLQVLAIDPACGAGVFLIEATRLIARRYAARLCGMSRPPELLVQAVKPQVMRECVFGVDIDPVAIDLAKTALWLEIEGREPFDFMDRNIIVGNALDDEMPPAFSERRGEPIDAEERRKAYADAP